jgi:hypothetical protein
MERDLRVLEAAEAPADADHQQHLHEHACHVAREAPQQDGEAVDRRCQQLVQEAAVDIYDDADAGLAGTEQDRLQDDCRDEELEVADVAEAGGRDRSNYRRAQDCTPTNGPFGFYGNIWCQPPNEASYMRNLAAQWPMETPPSLRYPKPSSHSTDW